MPKNKKSTTSSRKYVPYVKGFRPPTFGQQSEALGSTWKATPREYDNGQDFFESIPRCTSIDDWLVQYNEEGQTYHEFLFQTPWLSPRKLPYMKQTFNSGGTNLPEKYPDGKIYILPLGDFDSDSSPQFDALIEYATKLFFCLPVSKLPGVKLNHTEHDTFWVLEDGSNTTGSARKLRLSSRFDQSARYFTNSERLSSRRWTVSNCFNHVRSLRYQARSVCGWNGVWKKQSCSV